jgi:hypothetical protein
MVIAIDEKCPLKFVFPEDRDKPEKEQPFFLIKPLLQSELIEFYNRFAPKDGTTESIHSYNDVIEFVGPLLVGWGNFKNAEGEDIEFVPGDTEKNLNRFTMKDTLALITGILEVNQISDVDLKNSSLGQLSSGGSTNLNAVSAPNGDQKKDEDTGA